MSLQGSGGFGYLFLWPLILIACTAMFLTAMLMLVGSINIGMAPPKTWAYWITLTVLIGGSASCFYFLFG